MVPSESTACQPIRLAMPQPRQAIEFARLIPRSLKCEGLGYLALMCRAWYAVPGWLDPMDARLLFAFAHHGPGSGAIVEIGSAWGKSTLFLAQGSKQAKRERVYAVDPHTGDARMLTGIAAPPAGLNKNGYQLNRDVAFSSWPGFQQTINRFGVQDWVIPVVTTSTEAAEHIDTGPIRLLYLDGLHTYEGVHADIEGWLPKVAVGGVIVFDDYFNSSPDIGVRRAVDELVASGRVAPLSRVDARLLVWTRKR